MQICPKITLTDSLFAQKDSNITSQKLPNRLGVLEVSESDNIPRVSFVELESTHKSLEKENLSIQ